MKSGSFPRRGPGRDGGIPACVRAVLIRSEIRTGYSAVEAGQCPFAGDYLARAEHDLKKLHRDVAAGDKQSRCLSWLIFGVEHSLAGARRKYRRTCER